MGHFSIVSGGAYRHVCSARRATMAERLTLMPSPGPNLIIVAGPNGAGKTTAAADILVGALAVHEFVNADIIAKGLSSFQPESVAFDAGRIMLLRLHHLTAQRADVAFETTLASRTFASWIKTLTPTGYQFRLFFLWLPSADMAVERVEERVREGGHHVPEETIRRRYEAGLRNFFRIYRPLAASWRFYDNSHPGGRHLIASGAFDQATVVLDPDLWNNVNRDWK
jgi:predicted ABC-type ATPase